MLRVSDSRFTHLAAFVQRLDIEFQITRLISDALATSTYERLFRLLPSFKSLGTLVMMLEPPSDVHILLAAIPKSLKHLLWSKRSSGVSLKAPATSLFNFLDNHRQLETFSHPFYFDQQGLFEICRDESWKPYPLLKTWVIRDKLQLLNFAQVLEGGCLCPNMTSRTLVTDSYYDGSFIRDVFSRRGPAAPPNPATLPVTELNLTVTMSRLWWPPGLEEDDLQDIEALFPNLRDLNLTLNTYQEDLYAYPLDSIKASITQIPQITVVSIQRTVSDWTLSDPVGTLHHTIRAPWRKVFPNIQAIRIREDIDLGAVARHPTMAFVKGEAWDIRIEDRFGEHLAF